MVGIGMLLVPLVRRVGRRDVGAPLRTTAAEANASPSSAPADAPTAVRVQGYARHPLPGWSISHVMNNCELRCEIYGYPKQTLRECVVTRPDGYVGIARPSPHEPQDHFAFWYPREFEHAPQEMPIPDGEYRIEWTAVGDMLIRVHAFRISGGELQ